MDPAAIQIVGGHKARRGAPILSDLNLTIAQGSIVGLAGRSGSGKSTLLRCIQGLEVLDSGSLRVEGVCTLMFQDFQLFNHMTVLENLTYAPRIHAPDQDPAPRAEKLLFRLGLADKANAWPQSLSGGQKQRVALARCLMIDPAILLCDEPTSGLDIATMQHVVELFQKVRRTGMTLVVASHDLDFLVQLADRVVVLRQGCVVADVVPQESQDPRAFLAAYYAEEEV